MDTISKDNQVQTIELIVEKENNGNENQEIYLDIPNEKNDRSDRIENGKEKEEIEEEKKDNQTNIEYAKNEQQNEKNVEININSQANSSLSILQLKNPESPQQIKKLEKKTPFKDLEQYIQQYQNTVIIEDYKNGGGKVLHIFPQNLPSLTKSQYENFVNDWFHFIFIFELSFKNLFFYLFSIVILLIQQKQINYLVLI